jgi:hydrophobic/amphiphilic exporter-1 (mainly G- bacteria), HAE1 family
VRAKGGEVVDLGNIAHIAYGAAPSTITRTDRQRSVQVTSNLAHKTLKDAVDDAREVASAVLPASVTLTLAGQAEDMKESTRQFGIAIILGILVIYMILAAQFESLVHPLTVMLALPFAMVGALGGLFIFRQTINIFSVIGIILLFGLVTKNSILLVDYANQLRREEKLDKKAAMLRAAPIRMRPVLMTAIAMIFGVVPAAIGIGPGSETRMPMAIATATGMFSSTLLTLLIVPTFYVLFDDFAEKVKQWRPWQRRRSTSLPIDSSQPT